MVWTGFREECLFGGRRYCGLFTFREVKYCRRCVAINEVRWRIRRLAFGAVLCSWSVGVVGEVRRTWKRVRHFSILLVFVELFSMSSCTGVVG